MIRNLALSLCLLFPVLTHAQIVSEFRFTGQNSELLKTEQTVNVTRTRTVKQPSTCTREVPYTVNECRNVTRYREQCTWVGPRNECHTEYERSCRTVTRYREECSGSSSRTVCTERPSREVCTERPTREVCRTSPSGRQVCNTVGGGTHCTTVGGGQSCHEVPGNRTCRDVPYSDQECSSTPRQVCETIPGHNSCSQVPYSENVCEDVTRTRTESYACERDVEIEEVKAKKLISEIQVQILTNGIVEEFPVVVSLKETTPKMSAFELAVKLGSEPKTFVILQKKSVKIAKETETQIELKGTIVLELLEEAQLPISFPESIIEATVTESTKELLILLDGSISAEGSAEVLINHNTVFSRAKKIAEFKTDYPAAGAEIGQLEDKLALKLSLKDRLLESLEKKNMRLKLKLAATMNIQGEILNAKKPVSEKTLEPVFIKVK